MLRKIAAILVLAFVVIPSALACYCIFRSDLFSASPPELRPAGLYPLGEDWTSHHTQGPSFLLESRYRIGMGREEIQNSFAFSARLIASVSQPDKDWRAMGKGQLGLAYYMMEFERGVRSGQVAVCDVYDDGESHHVLFFDDAGTLIGAHQFPSSICLSACVESANHRSGANVGLAFWFAFERHWSGVLQGGC